MVDTGAEIYVLGPRPSSSTFICLDSSSPILHAVNGMGIHSSTALSVNCSEDPISPPMDGAEVSECTHTLDLPEGMLPGEAGGAADL